MNINIEKISNGFVLTLGGKRVFCDVPEAVCGELAQWALAECENATESTEDKVKSAMELMYRQSQSQNDLAKQTAASPLGNPPWVATLKS
jgi:hypothetical protein